MVENKKAFKSKEDLQEAILREKARGTPDIEIGEKYGVSFKFIEKVITQKKGINISNLNKKKQIKFLNPNNFSLEKTSVWSFKQRGNWATHSGEYRGNYSPYIPRNIILRYSKPGELVLDMFCGAGTTAIEAKLLGRRCIASDINEKAIELARENLDFPINLLPFLEESKREYYEPELRVQDARDLSWLTNESVDLICTHPPYANIIQYTDKKAKDLSFLDVKEFLVEMKKVAKESLRILKPGRQCALLIGDMRRKRHVIPLGFMLINIFLEAGFYLRELIIKRQHNCKTTGFWYNKSIENNFLLLAHEYLPVFEKPLEQTKIKKISTQIYTSFLEKKMLKLSKEISPLETTTVWIFPTKNKDSLLVSNLIQRYASRDKFICLKVSGKNIREETIPLKINKKYKLGWVKVASDEDSYSVLQPESILQTVSTTVEQLEPRLCPDGFIAIETRDIRSGNQLIPFGKLAVDYIKDHNLWLKEIIIVTPESSTSKLNSFSDKKPNEFLEIIHSYLLVYEKK